MIRYDHDIIEFYEFYKIKFLYNIALKDEYRKHYSFWIMK